MSGYLEHALQECDQAFAVLVADAENMALSKHALIVFGVAAITLDAARAETTKLSAAIESEVEQAVALAYAIRCCPAHDISEPVWDLRKAKYRRKYAVQGWSVDLADRDGSPFALEHVGGAAILRHLATYLRDQGVIKPPA
ncbi:MAG: hypothetical protein EOR00_26585 [Mesorhizobium sp.]|uniref:hypothetical protein n=1 Tax=Mesorhizobium sp. TaxID=1871066 RepID=UPI000FE6BC18|nr:hypothetical protein [Mesorhizobium sp.]RWP12711.1 MAG: hypothetical protein EOR00_26585 [Mesorhizobium sp.]